LKPTAKKIKYDNFNKNILELVEKLNQLIKKYINFTGYETAESLKNVKVKINEL